jgi:hypothetical protein
MLPKLSETSVNHKYLNAGITLGKYPATLKHNYNTLSTLVLLDYSNLEYLDFRHVFFIGNYSNVLYKNLETTQVGIPTYPTLNF